MKTNVDWLEIKSEYVNSAISKTDLAKKHNINRSTLSNKAVAEEWDKLRREQRDKNGREVNKILAKFQVQQNVEKMKLLISSGDNLCKMLDDKIKKAIQDDVDVREIKDLIIAYKDLIPAIRSVNNILTIQELEARQLALEKLELERQRMKQEEITDSEIVVKFEDDGLAYGE